MPVPDSPRPKRSARPNPVPPTEPPGSTAGEPPQPLPGRPLPRQAGFLQLWLDYSGSTKPTRPAAARFIPAVLDGLLATLSDRSVANMLYVHYLVMSGAVVESPCVPLPALAAHMPAFEEDGFTPVGPAACRLVATGDSFLAETYAAETVVPEHHLLAIGDLHPNGPGGDPAATERGVAELEAYVARNRVRVTVVAPAPGAYNRPLADRLASTGVPVKFLSDDPNGIVAFTIQALTAASRLLGGRPGPAAQSGAGR